MHNLETAEEILDFAIAKEADAHEFYMDIADRIKNPIRRELFERFAKEELNHKARLELEMMKRGKVVSDPEDSEEKQAVPTETLMFSDLNMDYLNLLRLAMDREEKSFRLFVELYAKVKEEDTRQMILELAEEEARHKLLLQIEYDKAGQK